MWNVGLAFVVGITLALVPAFLARKSRGPPFGGALIEMISVAMTLERGDVIITGTPDGVGAARKPPIFMRPGDVFEVEIEGIGVLSNVVMDE